MSIFSTKVKKCNAKARTSILTAFIMLFYRSIFFYATIKIQIKGEKPVDGRIAVLVRTATNYVNLYVLVEEIVLFVFPLGDSSDQIFFM